jgi:hypothetical protein
MKKIIFLIIFLAGINLIIGGISFSEDKSVSQSRLDEKVDEMIKILKFEPELSVYRPNKIDAVITLGLLRSSRCVDILIEYLENSNSDHLRSQIIKSLGWIGDEKAVPALIDALKNDNYNHARSVAARALGDMGDSQEIITALEEAYNKDEDGYIRIYAAKSLEKITGKSYLEDIEKELDKIMRP